MDDLPEPTWQRCRLDHASGFCVSCASLFVWPSCRTCITSCGRPLPLRTMAKRRGSPRRRHRFGGCECCGVLYAIDHPVEPAVEWFYAGTESEWWSPTDVVGLTLRAEHDVTHVRFGRDEELVPIGDAIERLRRQEREAS